MGQTEIAFRCFNIAVIPILTLRETFIELKKIPNKNNKYTFANYYYLATILLLESKSSK
jgi:hypothetical protein